MEPEKKDDLGIDTDARKAINDVIENQKSIVTKLQEIETKLDTAAAANKPATTPAPVEPVAPVAPAPVAPAPGTPAPVEPVPPADPAPASTK